MQTFLKKKTKCLIVILRMTNCIVDFFYDADNLGINFFFVFLYNALCYMGFRILGVVLVLFKYLWSKTLKKTTAKSDIYHSPIYPFLYICPQIQKRCRNILHTVLETVFKEHEWLIMVLVRILILEIWLLQVKSLMSLCIIKCPESGRFYSKIFQYRDIIFSTKLYHVSEYWILNFLLGA